MHQKDLLGKLTASLESLKTTQEATHAVLPRPDPYSDHQYGNCQTLDEIIAASQDRRDVPEITLLRCALADLVAQNKKPTTEEVFLVLETKFPWLKEEEGAAFLVRSMSSRSSCAHS